MPTMIHKNIVYNATSSNDLFALGAGARIKLTPRSSINLEYYYQLPGINFPALIILFLLAMKLKPVVMYFNYILPTQQA